MIPWGRPTPGLIVVCYARARCDGLAFCFWLEPGQTDPFIQRCAQPPDVVGPRTSLLLSPRCTHRLMEANFFCVARRSPGEQPTPFFARPLKPYLAAAAAVRLVRCGITNPPSPVEASDRHGKPQVSHTPDGMWERSIPDRTGYRMHIMGSADSPSVFLVPIRSDQQIRWNKGPESGFRQEASSWTGAATSWRVEGV